MFRKESEQTVVSKCIRGGNGEVEMHQIINSAEELCGKGRLFNKMILTPGNSIGEHYHTGDNEYFYILSGTGLYNDNGNVVRVQAGDTAICYDGQYHSMVNDGDAPLEFIALILYT